MKLTDKLDILMKNKSITRMEFSKQSGIPYTTLVSLYDKGYENVKLSTLKKIAEFFECSLDVIADDNLNLGDVQEHYIETIAAHHDSDEWSQEELEEIEEFKRFVKMKKAEKANKKD